eukprot:s941_g12.t1
MPTGDMEMFKLDRVLENGAIPCCDVGSRDYMDDLELYRSHEFYRSNSEVEFCHPSEQVPKFKPLHIPEDGGGIRSFGVD